MLAGGKSQIVGFVTQGFNFIVIVINEPRCEKTGLRGARPGLTQTGLYNHRRWLEALNLGFRKQRDCTICVAKTKALISFAATAKLIWVFVFRICQKQVFIAPAYSKVRYRGYSVRSFVRSFVRPSVRPQFMSRCLLCSTDSWEYETLHSNYP